MVKGERSRRELLQYGAGGAAVVLAGCSGQTPSDGDGDGGGGGPTLRVFDPVSGVSPNERHYNPWNPTQSGCWHPGANVFDRLAVYSPTQNEAYPLMATEWEMTSDTTLEATISEEWTWHDGTPFIADDWVMQMQIEGQIQKAASPNAEQLIQSVEILDDQHLSVTISAPLDEIFAVQNTIGIYNGNLARGVFTKHDDEQWTDWHERLMDSTGDALEQVIGEITTTAYPKVGEAVGNGPFQVSSVGDTEVIMEVYEDHPHVDDLNFDRMTLKSFASGVPTVPYSNGEVDAAHSGFPVAEDIRSQLPDGHTLFREGRSSNKLFAFNCGHDIEGYDSPVYDHRVRKAIMHIFDKSAVQDLLQGVNRMFEWPPCRVPGKVLEEGTVDVSDFEQYGQNDTERAEEYLRDAGFETDNLGNWLQPNGKRFEIDVMNGATRPDISILKRNLRQFGIAVTQLQVDDATFNERRKNGEFDIMPDGSSANGITAMWAQGLVVDWISSITHYDPEVEIPMPVGDPSGGGGTKTISIPEHIRQWQITGEERYHRELMWWWNQYLPEAEVMYKPDAGAYDGNQWELDVRDGIKNGVDDALYIAPKMADGTINYLGD